MDIVSTSGISPSFSADTLLQMAPFLARHDIDALDFLDRLGISPNLFLRHDAWFERDKVLQAGNELIRMTGNPFAGAYAGAGVPIAGFGTWGTIVSGAETVRQACELMAAKLDMVERGSRIVPVGENGAFRMAYRLDGQVGEDPLQILLATVAMMRNVALLCGEPQAVTVHLTMPRSYASRHLDEALGARLEFGSTFDGIEVDSDVLMLNPETASNPGLSVRAIDTAIAAAVAIDALLETGTCSIRTVAARLYMSQRTLQRRLKHCGVTFEDLLDVTRRDAALSDLAGGTSNMTDVAMRLGYSDFANFNRAFRRWTGTTPTKFAGSQ